MCQRHSLCIPMCVYVSFSIKLGDTRNLELLNLILQPSDAKTHVVGDRYVSMNICKTMQCILQFTELLEGWIGMWHPNGKRSRRWCKEELVTEIASQCMSEVRRKGTSKLWTSGILVRKFPLHFLPHYNTNYDV